VYAGIVPRSFDPQDVGNRKQRKSASCPSPQSVRTAGEYGEILAVVRDLDLRFLALFEDLACVRQARQIAPYHTVSEGNQQRALRNARMASHVSRDET